MFAVFYKEKFQDWWFNPKTDETWVERTCAAMGWNHLDVKVYWFFQPPEPGSVIIFNSDFSLSLLEEKTVDFQKENGEIEARKVWAEKEKRKGVIYYDCGNRFAV